MIYTRKEHIVKRSLFYAVVIIVLTVCMTGFVLSSQNFLDQFITYQFQIIFSATIILILALFIQFRQTADSAANAELHQKLEIIYDELKSKNKIITHKQAQMDQELQMAVRVQQAILNRYQPAFSQINIASRCIPVTNMGGDFYQLIMENSGADRCDIVIGDVAGHGMSSALVSVLCMVLFDQLAKKFNSPAQILFHANLAIQNYIRETSIPFVTVFYSRYSPQTQKLSYAKAGHHPALLFREGTWHELDVKGVFLGTFIDNVYEENEVQCQSGDWVIFYSDGLIEARSSEGILYELDRLKAVVTQCKNKTPSTLLEAIWEDVHLFSNGQYTDDRTLLVLGI